MSDKFTILNGVARWNSNGHVVPADCIAKYGVDRAPGFNAEATDAARVAETDAFLAEYRARPARVLSDEERYEMRAAFGEGVEIIDVISGQRFRT